MALSDYKRAQRAKAVLRELGYAVDNLWNIKSDVQKKFPCTDEEAHQILKNVLESENICEEINLAIDMEAQQNKFEEIEDNNQL